MSHISQRSERRGAARGKLGKQYMVKSLPVLEAEIKKKTARRRKKTDIN